MAQQDIQNILQPMCALEWYEARGHPRRPDDRSRLLAQLNPSDLIGYVIRPAERFVQGYAEKLQTEQAEPQYGQIKKTSRASLMKGVQTILMIGLCCLSLPARDILFYFLSDSFYNLYFYGTIIFECLNIVIYILYSFIERKKNNKYYLYYIGGEYVRGLVETDKKEIFKNYLNESAFPLLRSRLQELIERAKDIVEHLQEILYSLIAKLRGAYAASFREDRQVSRSFGGIASEVSVLANLIISLALGADRTPSWFTVYPRWRATL